MKPDKIYINPEYDLYRTQKNPPFEETYIRKDYLLEWAKEESEGNVGATYKVAMNNLIQKLNEI